MPGYSVGNVCLIGNQKFTGGVRELPKNSLDSDYHQVLCVCDGAKGPNDVFQLDASWILDGRPREFAINGHHFRGDRTPANGVA